MSDEARPATAAAPAKSATFERVAGTAVTPLRYELLRKEADGEFRAVPADYVFAAGDIVRVQVTSTRDGAVALTAAGSSCGQRASGRKHPDNPAASGGHHDRGFNERLVLSFAPPQNASSTVDERRSQRALQRVRKRQQNRG